MNQNEDFFSQYLKYHSDTEVPVRFHRWSAIAMVGAFLGRQFWIKHGTKKIYPNIYSMLIGNPGTRKNTAINAARGLLLKAGYANIAATKTTKEKYLIDLAEGSDGDADDILTKNLFGDSSNTPESFIMAPEFNIFFGNDILSFVSELGELWDYEGPYSNRLKNGKSISFSDPIISILAGNTPTSFNTAFPPEIIGQGFFSRILLIYGEPTGKKITFPKIPSDEDTNTLVKALARIRDVSAGGSTISSAAISLLDKIYKSGQGIEDVRFESFNTRRFTHLLKLCLIHAAARYSCEIAEDDVVYANTVLDAAENLMPKALGEFGKAKNSDVAQKIMAVLDGAMEVISLKSLFKHVSNDVENVKQLSDILGNLLAADKIQKVDAGFLAKKRVLKAVHNGVVHSGFLTKEETGEAI